MSSASVQGLYTYAINDLQSRIDGGQAEEIPSRFAYGYRDPQRPDLNPTRITWTQGIWRQRGSFRDLLRVVIELKQGTTEPGVLPLELLNREFVYQLYWQQSTHVLAPKVGGGVVDRDGGAALEGRLPGGNGIV
jgi:hypothetical protein